MSTLELLIGTHVENPAAFSPRPPLMKRMCSGRPGRECGLVLGWVICVPEMDGKITSGLCECCALIALEELDALPRTL